MFSLDHVLVGLSTLASVLAVGLGETHAPLQRDNPVSLYGSTGAPDLADFDTTAALVQHAPILYALKRFETLGWYTDRIHAASVDGKDAAYYDIYGQDGGWKAYPVALDDSPSWIRGYNAAQVKALYSADQVTMNSDKTILTVGNLLGMFTGRPVEEWTADGLGQDSLLDILKTFNISPVVLFTKETASTLNPNTFFAVTNVAGTSIELWYCELLNVDPTTNKCLKTSVDVKEVLDNLGNVGRLRLGEELTGGGKDAQEDWEGHKADVVV